jgi:DNA-binding transcriptional LysR family regulator
VELRHLKYFVTVAEELNFSRAAERLHIAQPPLSQQIMKLERELGVRLFDRSARQIRLTPAGQSLLHDAYDILARADRAAVGAHDSAAGFSGTLSIACVASGVSSVLVPVLRAFRSEFPDVRVSLRVLSSSAQLAELEATALDLGLMRAKPSRADLVSRTLFEEPFVVALSADHPFAAKAEVPLSALADQSFVLVGRQTDAWYFATLLAVCDGGGFTPRIAYECDNVLAELALVSAGMAVALLPRSMDFIAMPGVVMRELSETTSTGLEAVWPKRVTAPARDNFLEIAQQVLDAPRV